MAVTTNRRAGITLYAAPDCPYSHRARIVLAEKIVTAEVVMVEERRRPEELAGLNPYNTLPVLMDRDLVLYDSRVIMEYLDERFPHPPLMPVDPVSRAKTRLALFHIEQDWYGLLPDLEAGGRQATKARKTLLDSITSSLDVFAAKPYFLSDEFSMADCYIAPILWRLGHFGIELPPAAKAIQRYTQRIFARRAFQASLSELEREMQRA